MKKALSRVTAQLYHYKDGKKVNGPNSEMTGDCSGLRGYCSWIRGDCSGLYGDCSGLRGDCSGLRGNCSGLRGNLDECDITDEDRKKGIDIAELVGEKD